MSVIRPATVLDATTMAGIGAATFALACPPSTPAVDLEEYRSSELTPARFAAHLRNPVVSAYLADVSGKPAGYLMLRIDEQPSCISASPNPLQLWRLYVLPQFHGAGPAAALIETTFNHARRRGCDLVWLGVSEHNARGIAFYRKHGFTVVGDQTFHVGADAHHDLVMSCSVR